MDKPKNKNFANTASRISSIASSVMDLHVRIALQEVDREKRRLISGAIFITIGGILLLLVLVCIHIIFYLNLSKLNNWATEYNLLLIIFVDLFLAGLSLKLGGKLTKGPYLPQTFEGLGKTTKAVLGKK
ncbi:phage holin family protein [Prochlorococcus sp. AH-716-K03]|nr:phage holin family protein [Prochlorococcus sp. AH-716-K03]